MREMKMHENYKCRKCKEFHSIDFDTYIKQLILDCAISCSSKNMEVRINDSVSFCPACIIRNYSKARKTHEIQLIDRHLDHFSSKSLSVENRIPSHCLDEQEDAIMGRFHFEFCRCVCKAIGLDEKICIVELKDRSGYLYSATIIYFLSTLPAIRKLHNLMDVFTVEPIDQWIEISNLCYSFVRQSWLVFRPSSLPVPCFSRLCWQNKRQCCTRGMQNNSR